MEGMRALDFLRGWLAAAIAYVIAERTSTLLGWFIGDGGVWQVSALASGELSPWVAPAVLSVIAAVVAVRRKVRAPWWKWLILTVAVPAAGGAFAVHLANGGNIVDLEEVLPWVITHVVLAGVLGVSVGAVLNKVRATSQVLRAR